MGPIVARGYLDEPEKTAKAFILQPNWFKEPNYTTPLDTNRRIYRTGDMAYLKSDGSVVFCGRIDTQVKIRGQRIELGEIEAQLRHVISDLDDVAVEVLCLSEDRSNKGLAAFVSLKSDWTGGKLRVSSFCKPLHHQTNTTYRQTAPPSSQANPNRRRSPSSTAHAP